MQIRALACKGTERFEFKYTDDQQLVSFEEASVKKDDGGSSSKEKKGAVSKLMSMSTLLRSLTDDNIIKVDMAGHVLERQDSGGFSISASEAMCFQARSSSSGGGKDQLSWPARLSMAQLKLSEVVTIVPRMKSEPWRVYLRPRSCTESGAERARACARGKMVRCCPRLFWSQSLVRCCHKQKNEPLALP